MGLNGAAGRGCKWRQLRCSEVAQEKVICWRLGGNDSCPVVHVVCQCGRGVFWWLRETKGPVKKKRNKGMCLWVANFILNFSKQKSKIEREEKKIEANL